MEHQQFKLINRVIKIEFSLKNGVKKESVGALEL